MNSSVDKSFLSENEACISIKVRLVLAHNTTSVLCIRLWRKRLGTSLCCGFVTGKVVPDGFRSF